MLFEANTFPKQFKMKMFLLFFVLTLTCSFLIPVPTGSQRCMVIYSINQEDTIKISMKFPQDRTIQQFYDYMAEIRDLSGRAIISKNIINYVFRTELIVPNNTIYEACIRISPNLSKSDNYTHKYQGQILVDYEANTHFVAEEQEVPFSADFLQDQDIVALRNQANHVINATQEYIRLQTLKKINGDKQFFQKRDIEDNLFDWWMVELLMIIGIGAVQWNKLKRKLADSQC